MKYSRLCAFSLTVAMTALYISVAPQTMAKNRATGYLKYLNPLPQKKGYLNESQDRLIKKQKFNVGDLNAGKLIRNPEQGLFVILSSDKLCQTESADALLSDEKVSGISVLIPWKVLEPAEEKYDWTVLDGLLALCQKHNKTMILRVSTCGVDQPGEGGKACADTPAWVWETGAKSVKYLDKSGNPHLMPIFWDQTYLAAFSNFINEMGSRYDKNVLIHSVGITGGGFRGGTAVLPGFIEAKGGEKTASNESGLTSAEQIDDYLRKQQEMTQKKIVDHWKYVADLFPQAFANTRLNFAINPPTPNRAGEDALDEISDYLLFRYGQHIYITRQDLKNGRHGFDDYRVQLKFRQDTYCGVSLLPGLDADDMARLSRTALDDGISFVELPPEILSSPDPVIKQSLDKLAGHLGYQIITQKAAIPAEIQAGDPLKAEFSFVNAGDTSPKRPVREMDKDVASSYQIMIELKDASGKVVARILHTPDKKTERWKSGEIISWQKSLKMPQLPGGEYQASVSLYDRGLDRKLNILDGRDAENQQVGNEIALGKLKIKTPATADKALPN
jgi:hypothetical protein